MPTLRKPKSFTLSADELAKLAGVEMSGAKVSRGADDSNVCTLTATDGSVLTFSRAELLAAIRLEDGYVATTPGSSEQDPPVVGHAPETSRLPMGVKSERHADGRPHDHVDAGITFAVDGDGLTLSWLEDA